MSEAMECRMKGALLEADRCLQCYDPPCAKGCPAGVEVDRFIRLLSKGDFAGAAAVIEKDNPMGWICGYICPQESLCQKNCISHQLGHPIDIKILQQYAIAQSRAMGEGHQGLNKNILASQRLNINGSICEIDTPEQGFGKAAVVGGGPGGMTCAAYLHQLGYEVDLFEAGTKLGGRMTKGIPSFRMDQNMLYGELDQIAAGIKVNFGKKLGRDFSLSDLKAQGFQSIFLATGKWNEKMLPLPGADLAGVYGSDEILTGTDWQKSGHQKAAIIGAGNVAMDVARVLYRGGLKEVHVFFIGANPEVTAWPEEREEVFTDGGILHMLAIPEIILGEVGKVAGLKLNRSKVLRKPDGNWSVESLPDDLDFNYPVDMVVMAIGCGTFKQELEALGLKVDTMGHILVDENLETNVPGVFAGGDTIGQGRGAVVQAIGDGKRAALNMHAYLQGLAQKEGK